MKKAIKGRWVFTGKKESGKYAVLFLSTITADGQAIGYGIIQFPNNSNETVCVG
ncbi:hypothetical protein FACS1894170_11440 [Planctomycetales bacterium]|nr:hypothetical protein FACS1894170_11440 [Planctomycetales bacterium]